MHLIHKMLNFWGKILLSFHFPERLSITQCHIAMGFGTRVSCKTHPPNHCVVMLEQVQPSCNKRRSWHLTTTQLQEQNKFLSLIMLLNCWINQSWDTCFWTFCDVWGNRFSLLFNLIPQIKVPSSTITHIMGQTSIATRQRVLPKIQERSHFNIT